MHKATSVVLSGVCCVALLGCAGSNTREPEHAANQASPPPVSVPVAPSVRELPRVRVASDLANPRGMQRLPDGSFLVATAGTGDPANPNTGALLHLIDRNADGDFDDEGERTVLLGDQPSKNLLDLVRRDEVFGMAGMAEGEGEVLVSLAFFGGPSTIMKVKDLTVSKWSVTHANVNDLVFDPQRKGWFGVASTSDEVVRLREDAGNERVVKIPSLASGQDPVPSNLVRDPVSGDLLVTLFSGSPEGEEGGEGVEIVPRAARIVRVTPETQAIAVAVSDLTVPTDLEATPDGKIYVLEFCDAFLDPVKTREDMARGPSHGGFRRFSGRLLQIDRKTGEVLVLARGLDAPTNLTLAGNALYIAEGMGTPGRQIPGPDGAPRTLTGFIERIDLPGS
ncbi:MAG TPA: hypothetical protein VJV78_27645 [Polyangiales bacterium]|nr:hypothetical protein [Polyangiales bacterium]